MKPQFLLLLLTSSLSSALSAQTKHLSPKRVPNMFLVPKGYVGWLHVEYGVRGAPRLPLHKGFRLYKFPRSGRMRTSSPLLLGWARDRIYYTGSQGWKELHVSPAQGKGMIWGESLGMGGVTVGDGNGKMRKIPTPATEDMFIGTWKQFYGRKSEAPRSQEEEAALKAKY